MAPSSRIALFALCFMICAYTNQVAEAKPSAKPTKTIKKTDPKKRIWLGYLLIDEVNRRVAFLFIEDGRVSMENAVAPKPIQEDGNTIFVAPSSVFEKAEVILAADGSVSVRYHMEDCTMIGPVQNLMAKDSAAG